MKWKWCGFKVLLGEEFSKWKRWNFLKGFLEHWNIEPERKEAPSCDSDKDVRVQVFSQIQLIQVQKSDDDDLPSQKSFILSSIGINC